MAYLPSLEYQKSSFPEIPESHESPALAHRLQQLRARIQVRHLYTRAVTSRQIPSGAWVGPWGGPARHLGAQGSKIALIASSTMPGMGEIPFAGVGGCIAYFFLPLSFLLPLPFSSPSISSRILSSQKSSFLLPLP
jgi:hypothetical protein